MALTLTSGTKLGHPPRFARVWKLTSVAPFSRSAD